jgi:hypothetical protein
MPPAAALAATAAHRQARRNVTQTLRICRVNAHFDCCRVFNRSETRGTGRRAGSTTPITLNLINPHVGDARLPESERCGGLRRDVYHSAMNERSPAKIVTTTLRPLSRLTTRTCDPMGRLRCAANSPG